MNRRNFIKGLSILSAAAVVAPVLLTEKRYVICKAAGTPGPHKIVTGDEFKINFPDKWFIKDYILHDANGNIYRVMHREGTIRRI